MASDSVTLLKNGLLATFTDADGPDATPTARRADVLIKGDRIVQVAGPNSVDISGVPDPQIIDCFNKWIAPGFVDTHRHLWMSVMEGQEDWTLAEYLAKHSWTMASVVDAEDVYIGQLAGAMQALHGGTTTVVDHFHCANSPEHISKAIEAVSEAGLRCMLCVARQVRIYTTHLSQRASTPSNSPTTKACPRCNSRRWRRSPEKTNGKLTPDGRVTLGLAYDVLGSNPDEDRRIVTLARSLGITPITAHYVGGPHGKGYSYRVRAWHEAGLLEGDLVFSHANGLTHVGCDEEEWTLLKESGASIAATPEDELGMGHGDPVVPHPLHARTRPPNPQSPHPQHPHLRLRLPPQHPRRAQAAHASTTVGSIEPGKLADIVLYDADSINLAGCTDPFRGVVMHATAQDVAWVFVGGKVVKREGRLVPVEHSGEGKKGREWGDVARVLKERMEGIRARVKGVDMEARYTQVAQAIQLDV
ncbi:hypothetical protein EW146_g5197 [Bondarzewia mesenterica]|uniref:Amidohydrolase-related domain-containing protein n=1 Tax=Bondarzewia mesenterica TaxID=1095465 RepID=A0A4S4LS75_9AGAM|nr:hypothetical protein EW146_g5197 [Bondarzewia mesenterica]